MNKKLKHLQEVEIRELIWLGYQPLPHSDADFVTTEMIDVLEYIDSTKDFSEKLDTLSLEKLIELLALIWYGRELRCYEQEAENLQNCLNDAKVYFGKKTKDDIADYLHGHGHFSYYLLLAAKSLGFCLDFYL